MFTATYLIELFNGLFGSGDTRSFEFFKLEDNEDGLLGKHLNCRRPGLPEGEQKVQK